MKHGKKKKKKKEKKVNGKNKKKEKKREAYLPGSSLPAWVVACVGRELPCTRVVGWAGIIGPWFPSDPSDGKIPGRSLEADTG